MQELNAACRCLTQAVNASLASGAGVDTKGLEEACSQTVEKLQQVLRSTSHLTASSSQLDPAAMDHDHSTSRGSAVKEVLERLMHQLDGLAEGLHETLQDLDSPAIAPAKYLPDPREVITYAHRIRYTTFARVGTVSLPPAPQPWQLAQSSLNAFGKAQSAAQSAALAAAGLGPSLAAHSAVMQSQMAAQAAAHAAQQGVGTDVKPEQAGAGTGAPPFPAGFVLQDGAVLPPQLMAQQEAPPVAAPRAPVVGLPTSTAALDLLLNPDLEEVSEASSSDDDDSDWA